ncbi:PAS domain S-box [Desulfocurvibacter africanus PCS]|uniref:histidine kinase n=1 Tax=Desulfocurvibacter africanus PCS TaxID=1262666 RepID=M5PPB8_DESAF|nr:PAS domain S-box protein [Desulfocurvibacter africanus]EMG35770.1 PAS domain S-box [Desulfocurvibacter africanus PCS]
MPSARILIVEDEPVTRLEIAGRLQGLGYAVVGTACAGEEAVHKAGEIRPELVLMDISLASDLDGIGAAAAIRERFAIPVVYLTADSQPETLERAKITGPFGYLVKPFDNADLHSTIEIALYKHQIDKRLQQSEDRYRTIFENAMVGIYRSTPEGRFVSVNAALAGMLGYDSPEQLMDGVRSIELQIYADEDRRAEFLRLLRERGSVEHFESQVFGRDGDALWISESARLLCSNDCWHIDGTVIDISARKEAESAYKSTFELLDRTIDAIPDLVAVTDLDGHIILANAAFARTFGLSKDEVRAHRYQDLVHGSDASSPVNEESRQRIVRPLNLEGSFQETASPFKDLQGVIIGTVRVLRAVADSVGCS